MYIYLLASKSTIHFNRYKLGCTGSLYERHSNYQTGCPPGLDPSHDLNYVGIWETNAETIDELRDIEELIHDHFHKYRTFRNKPNDTEWFDFSHFGKNILEIVNSFITNQDWFKRSISINEIPKPKKNSYFRHYRRNTKYIKDQIKRNNTFDIIQKPVINDINIFLKDENQKAGYVIAPCGSGKTRMTCSALEGIFKCVILCPSSQIQLQWEKTLILNLRFTNNQILKVGDRGTTDINQIKKSMWSDKYCIISTNYSSHLLNDLIDRNIQVVIFDEAHHMAGTISTNDEGEGRTRRFLQKVCDLQLKRLFLTYTPRFIKPNREAEYFTMDDVYTFGHCISQLKIRDLINKGVLPDYRIWKISDEDNHGSGITSKMRGILEAWYEMEYRNGKEKYIINHLIIFTRTIDEAKIVEEYLNKNKTDNTIVLRVNQGDNIEHIKRRFENATRAILVNCFVLGEGVDIPIADSVVITYPKQSRGQITQMILRAGRPYINKDIFHILIPAFEDEDFEAYEEVLNALASHDEQIRDEIMYHSGILNGSTDKTKNRPISYEVDPKCIIIQHFDSSEDSVRNCFGCIRKRVIESVDTIGIRDICNHYDVKTSVEYINLRKDVQELPEDPKPRKETWYDYLNPFTPSRISHNEFKEHISKNKLTIGYNYDEWHKSQQNTQYPSLQNINDGYFGENLDFNHMITNTKTNGNRRGRR